MQTKVGEKKSKIGLSTLLLQVKTSAFFSFTIPLTIDKTGAAIEVAIQYYFRALFFCKNAGDHDSRIANEFICTVCFKTGLVEVAKYFGFVLWIDLDGDKVDLTFSSEITFPDTANFFA